MVKRIALAFTCAIAFSVILTATERGPWRLLGKGPGGIFTPITTGVQIPVGDINTPYMQNIVNANPMGSTFTIKAGVHRLQTIAPRQGDTYIGETGAIMSGSRLLTGWTFSHLGCHGIDCWFVDGQTQQGHIADEINAHSGCSGDATIEGGDWYPICFWPEDVYYDDTFAYHCKAFATCMSGTDGNGIVRNGWYLDYNGGGAFFMSTADRLYVFTDPTTHKVEASVNDIAFSTGINVTIKNIVFEKYATPYARAAIDVVNGMVLDGVEGRLNHYAGTATGFNGTIQNSLLHHNMCVGDNGGGNAKFLNIETYFNNFYQAYDEFWGCGGSKWNQAQGGLQVRNSRSHNNIGPGFWCDTSCDGLIYDSNTIDDNTRGGIFQEISYGATITHNTIRRNGYGRNGVFYTGAGNTAYATESGIAVSSSTGVEAAFNTLIDNYGSIQGVQDDRCHYDNQGGQTTGRFWYLMNMNIHDNIITSTVNLNNGIPPSNGIYDSEHSDQHNGLCPNPWHNNNAWVHNTYTFGSFTTLWFVWEFGSFNRYTTAQWQGIPQDATGTFH